MVKRVLVAAILFSLLIFSGVASAFWPFDWIKERFTGKVISTSAKSVPLVIKDVTNASRYINLNDGKTEYFTIGNPNNLVYLSNFDNSYKYDYEGKTYSGALIVYHTFGANANAPFIVDINYLNNFNSAKQIQVYFPAFDTSSSGKKMYFYVDAEGSTYYADAENDGLNDESTELLTVNDALTEAHLARKAPSENEVADKDTTTLPATPTTIVTCSDSDANREYPTGLNYYLAGVADNRVNGLGSWYEDTCLFRNKTGFSSWQYVKVDGCSGDNCNLQEGYCKDNGVSNIAYKCPYGCIKGACAPQCIDSDNGRDYSVKGTTIGTWSIYKNSEVFVQANQTDLCAKDVYPIDSEQYTRYKDKLYEYYCTNDGYYNSETYTCPGGECKEGNCIPEYEILGKIQTCKDGTLYGQCSEEKPFYCYEGTRIQKCSVCGCGEGERCNNITEFCEKIYNSVSFESIGTAALDINLVYPRGQLIQIYPIGEGLELVKRVIYEISINDALIFKKDADCTQENCLSTIWTADQGISMGRNDYTINITLIDQNNKKINRAEIFSIEFKEIDSSLCKELIPGQNDISADRANIVFVGFFDQSDYLFRPGYCQGAVNKFCESLEIGLGKQGYGDITKYEQGSISFICRYKGEIVSEEISKSIDELSNLDEECKYLEETPEEVLRRIAEEVINFNGNKNGLFSVEPFKSNKDKFNFWYVDRTQSLSYCPEPREKGFVLCEDPDSLAGNCLLPNKYVTFIVDKHFRSSGGYPIMLSSEITMSVPPYSSVPTIFVHEFGHQFGLLRDEYIEFPGTYSRPSTEDKSQNCYAGLQQTQEECLQNTQWKSFIGRGCGDENRIDCTEQDANYNLEIGCFEGCGYYGAGIFRPSFNTIMRCNACEPYSFGPWNEKLINDIINRFTG